MKTDYEIAKSVPMQPIDEIAAKVGLNSDELIHYGKYKAKIELTARNSREVKAKLVLVTAMTPTPAGEGKTTVCIGLHDALNQLGHKSLVTLREPSLGPVFGMKGGAAGGGMSQVIPMDEINLHFTGDLHAISAAHNLLAAMMDNTYTRHSAPCLCVKANKVLWNRTVDMNDRALRDIVVGLSDEGGQVRETSFEITAASEVMAIMGLAYDLDDLKERLGRITVAISDTIGPITASQIHANGAMAILLKDALKPNIVQTLEGNPALIHTGPFANIAHGTNSVVATDMARRLSDIVIIEAGFGSDLGAEKFFNLVSRQKGMAPPDAVVIVATIRALKYQGGINRNKLKEPNPDAVATGFPNLEKHIENMKSFNRPVIVAINGFTTDSDEEIKTLEKLVENAGAKVCLSTAWTDGGKGALNLAKAVWDAAHQSNGDVQYVYDLNDPIVDKIKKVSEKIYGAAGTLIPRSVIKKIEQIEKWGHGNLPICIAKTQNSISDDPDKKGRPVGDVTEIRDVKVNTGAGFVVVYAGEIMTMPGLPKNPAAAGMDIDNQENIVGLF
ncbi:MAG: formate--tetrahydrofolate ligase [bacterium]